MTDATMTRHFGLNSEYGVLRDVLLCRPDHFRWAGINAISKAVMAAGIQFDPAAAMVQHDGMVAMYKELGVTCHFLDTDPDLHYQCFARDSSVMTPFGPIVCLMYQPLRRGEYVSVLDFYKKMDIPVFGSITTGTMEGGDFHFMKPDTCIIGCTGERTNDAGANQAKAMLEARGVEVRIAHIAAHFLHLDVIFGMLAPGLAAVCMDVIPDWIPEWLKSLGVEILPVAYKDAMRLGCNVVSLGQDRVLSTAHNKKLNDRMKALGLKVYTPELDMFTQGGGGVHCLCQPMLRDFV